MHRSRTPKFYGWRVAWAAFVLAVFGLGMGFHGPPIYLHAVIEARGWPLTLVSTAVTVHFLVGALVAANLPMLYRRFGIPGVTRGGAVALALGVVGWATAATPWQLFAATLLSGGGWVTMGVAAINAIVTPWFVRQRPVALAIAYNGANLGGVIFAPLWVTAIAFIGFPAAASVIGIVMTAVVWAIASTVLTPTPQQMDQAPDGDVAGSAAPTLATEAVRLLPGRRLWRDRRFLTLAAGMAIGLFAQIGITAHLYSLLVPALGARSAGFAMALMTAMAVAGRTCIGWLMPVDSDWRVLAAASYGLQVIASLAFILAAGQSIPMLLLGVVLFGLAFGNGTWLPPLIAQVEFLKEDAARVVPLIVAIAQAAYAFAPAVFGLLRGVGWGGIAPASDAVLYMAAAVVQIAAIACFLGGRERGSG